MARRIAPGDILLLCGLSGSGKSHYAKWLATLGWGVVDRDLFPPEDDFMAGLGPAIAGDDRALLDAAARYPPGMFVVEWGFPPEARGWVGKMIDRGYNAWYFDGDPDAARESFLDRNDPADIRAWWAQYSATLPHRDAILELYGEKVIRRVEAGPRHLTPGNIHEVIGPSLPGAS